MQLPCPPDAKASSVTVPMRIWNRSVALIALLASLTSCAENTGLNPIAVHAPLTSMAVALPDVRISELHYDNTGTDADEAIEISGPAGTDLTGWQIVLYNGTGGLAYGTTTLSGPIPASASCSTRGVIVQTYPSNGIQNGSPDGIALVDATGTVVEFLSYEGTFAAVDGPAAGLTSVDIGATEMRSGIILACRQRPSRQLLALCARCRKPLPAVLR